MVTKVILTITLILFSLKNWAQETPPITNFFPKSYKAQNQNWALTQSTNQFIYSANSDGLLEYNGESWKLYPLPVGQIVRSILCTKFGSPSTTTDRIYAGGFGEFGFWERTAIGNLKYTSLSKPYHFQSLKTEEIWHILKAENGIYFQSFSKIFHYDGLRVTEISSDKNIMFLRSVHHRIIVQQIGKGLFELLNDQFKSIPNTDLLANTIVTSILPYGKSDFLIATAKHGLYRMQNGHLHPWNIEINSELKENVINKVIQLDDSKNYVFGTIKKGVYVVSKNGVLEMQISKEGGLQNNTVLALQEDSDGNIWLGLDQGIDMIQSSSPLRYYQTVGNPLGSCYTAALWRNKLYVGTNNGVFVKKWGTKSEFQAIPGLEGQTWNLAVYEDQLICGHNDATFRINENSIEKISEITGGWKLIPVISQRDTVLIQGSYTGLHVYKMNKKRQWTYAHAIKGVPPIPIKNIVPDQKGGFWLSHAYKGLYYAQFDPELKATTIWKNISKSQGLPVEFNVDVSKIGDSILIKSGNSFLTPSNNLKLTPHKEVAVTAAPFKLRPGYKSDWFKVYRDHVALHRQGQIQLLNVALIRDNEVIVPLTNEDYLFCLDNGFALYNTHTTTQTSSKNPKTQITKFCNLDQLTQQFNIRNNIQIPFKVRSIRMEFTLPIFDQNIQYQYRLVGLSPIWSEWSELSFADYTNLTSGNYTFEVKNNLNNSITQFQFNIEKYWYETLIAKFGFTAIAIFLLFALVSFQEKRIKNHQSKILAEQEEKLRKQKLESERKLIELKNENLQKEINNKSQKLSNIAINVVRKNEILEDIRDELKQVKAELGQQLPNLHYQKILNSIERNVAGKEDWDLFEENFNQIHEEFFLKLRSIVPNITPSELRLAACLRMNLSTKEMAPVIGISIRGVEIKRYRLRKKLNLDADSNLVDYMMDI